ncbi:hypothetical protein LYNGBM3L_65400 [Moorena producens 3L]|uniref:Uncharacterized protein n=1 Tax=Moorena producens 3L TaxID=489825 RepID=F4Y227_9CYAN|nr:hypothetical protein LYNGBM3L_65400 [Moorena producens 3L]
MGVTTELSFPRVLSGVICPNAVVAATREYSKTLVAGTSREIGGFILINQLSSFLIISVGWAKL